MPFDQGGEVLPLELFAHIVHAAREDSSTLRSLCLVSKCFLEISQRCLYRQVRLGGIKLVTVGGKQGRWSVVRINISDRFFRTITLSPHLTRYIRDFSFRPDLGHTSEYFWDAFHQALHCMVNLKYLQLTLMDNNKTFYRILKNLCDHPFQLEVFSWKDFRRGMTDQDEVAFLSFIASQPHLRAIDILSSSKTLLLPPKSCPTLTTFMGDYSLATSVLQNRSVTNFVWLGSRLDPAPLLGSGWATIFSSLRLLVFFNHFPADMDLTVMLGQLPSLEALQISLESRTAPSSETLNKATELLQRLFELGQLRVLTWTGTRPDRWGTSKMNWVDGFKAATVRWFDHSKIERVYLSCSSENQERFIRWKRDGFLEPNAVEVSSNDLIEFYHGLNFDGTLIDPRFIYGQ